MRSRFLSAVLAAFLVAAPAAAQSEPAAAPTQTLAQLVKANADMSTLAELLEATGLAAKLDAAGPLTLYAPGNSAFARIPADTLAALKADKARLTRVLAHHVLPRRFTGLDMMNTPIYGKVETAAGDSMVVYHDKGGIKVDLSMVKTGDIEATNGVMHTVHKVILVP